MQVQLVMFKSDGTRRDFTLTRGRIVIGRTNEAGLRIPLSSVSRKHCEIVIEDGVVKMRDLGSSNGTMHNSERVKEAVLSPGDQIEVGPVVFIVVIDGVPAEVEPVRSLLEQELVDTSVGLPAQDEDEAPAVVDQVVSKPKPAQARVMEPPPSQPPPPMAPIEDEVIGELDPVSAQDEIDPLEAAAAKAAKAAQAKPAIKPEESFSDGATEVDLDDPIAALERLAAAEAEADAGFSMFTKPHDAKASAKKAKK